MGENKEQEQIAIAVQNVCKIYKLYDKPMDRLKEALGLTRNVKHREHFALNNVNFQVKQGECVGIIGTNGSGKSTILKIITGVLNPTSGAVTVKRQNYQHCWNWVQGLIRNILVWKIFT